MINPQIRPAELPRGGSAAGNPRIRGDASGPRVILLFTRDRALDQLLAEALLGTSAIILIARTVSDAVQIACGRGRELDFAVVDIDEQCRGMTLLSAIHTCYDELPILMTATRDDEQLRLLAYANGARACLKKPLTTVALVAALETLSSSGEATDVPRRPESRARPASLGISSPASSSQAYASIH